MSSPQGVHEELARRLEKAEREALPIAPITETHPDLQIADAYDVQTLNIDRRLREGRRLVGRKIGLTSKAMQEALGVNEPDYGALLDDMIIEDGGHVAFGTLIAPRVEAEIGFVLGRDLSGPAITTVDALRAIDGAYAAIEVIDSRITDWRIRLVDTIADNASAALIVSAGRIVPLDSLDLRTTGVVLTRNGDVVQTGAGAAALGNPARCVAWLANKLAEFGESLHAGELILPGALHRAEPVTSGDVIRAEFATLGSVNVSFVGNGR